MDQEEIDKKCNSKNPEERKKGLHQLINDVEYLSDKKKVWEQLVKLISDKYIYTSYKDVNLLWKTADILGIVFLHVPDKKQASEDLYRLTSDKDSDIRWAAAKVIGTVFQHAPDKKQAWKELAILSADKDRHVRSEAVKTIGTIFQYAPDRKQAWEELVRLTSDIDSDLRWEVIDALGTVFQYVPEKNQGWKEIIRLISDKDPYISWRVVDVLEIIFQYVPDKKQASEDLYRLTSDEDSDIRWVAAKAIGTVFQYVPDKNQAWEELARLALDQKINVRWKAAEAVGVVFQYVPNKTQAWEDLVRLTSDKDRDVRNRVAEGLKKNFQYVPNKQKAWEDLVKLISDQSSDVRSELAKAIGMAFQYVPDKKQALQDLHKLTSDKDTSVRIKAYHSLGRISIYNASQSKDEEVYLDELKKAVEFFEKAAKEPNWDNPSKFCFPFYSSFYTIIFAKNRDAKGEVEKYLIEAKNEIRGSKNKKLLLEIIESLMSALNEVQNLENMSLEKKKEELDFYRKYCERAEELMKNTEKAAPSATKVMRIGSRILDRKLKFLLKEIQEKAKIACRESQGTDTEEIACAVKRKVQGWKAGTEEEMALDAEDLLTFMKSNVPRFPENEHIFEKIKEIENQKDLNLLLRSIPDLLKELPKIMIDPERVKPTIGIITALPKEYVAVNILMENKNDKYKIQGSGAGRRYCLGEILSEEGDKHNLVLATVGMGNNIAATRASILLEHFPNVKSIIMVGIAGGVPYPDKADDHVRLGDIVVSSENGVVQYDFIKQEIEDITHRNPPRPPSASLLDAVRYLEAEEILGNRPWEKYIDQSLSIIKIIRPSEDKDILYCSDSQKDIINHPKDPKRIKGQPRVFIGSIASANILQKDPKARDKLRDKFGVKAIEMEASGIADATWNHEVGYLVVRGICDYCDSHKNDEWQQYAAVVAAAYTRALIESIP